MQYFILFSAKVLVKGEPNVAYICSRYYRAPELIFGATDYTSNIGNTKRMIHFAAVKACFKIFSLSTKCESK